MKITDKYVFFWGEWLSNFYPCKITYGNHTFKSSEQLFMYLKAIYFEDFDTAKLILQVETPKEAKNLGRKVKNFDDKLWEGVKLWYMQLAVDGKFAQNRGLMKKLKDPTLKNKLFVETSPYDRIWGIGYSEEDALENIDNWGANLLGRILTTYRNSL